MADTFFGMDYFPEAADIFVLVVVLQQLISRWLNIELSVAIRLQEIEHNSNAISMAILHFLTLLVNSLSEVRDNKFN